MTGSCCREPGSVSAAYWPWMRTVGKECADSEEGHLLLGREQRQLQMDGGLPGSAARLATCPAGSYPLGKSLGEGLFEGEANTWKGNVKFKVPYLEVKCGHPTPCLW